MSPATIRLLYEDIGAALGELNHLRAPEFSGVAANIRQRLGLVRKQLADEMSKPTQAPDIRKTVPAIPARQTEAV